MDAFRLCVALGPLAIYFLLLGGLNLLRRPFLTTGARDTAALGVAVAGFIIVGPVELFLPHQAWGSFVWLFWLLLIAFYGLGLTLVVLIGRPRLVVYNISIDEFRPVLAEVIESLDADARWAGNSLVLPRLSVQLHMDSLAAMRNVTLTATGDHQSYTGWRTLERALAAALADVEVAPNPGGVVLTVCAMIAMLFVGVKLIADPQAITQGFRDILRL
jgi:hypothetical protein